MMKKMYIKNRKNNNNETRNVGDVSLCLYLYLL